MKLVRKQINIAPAQVRAVKRLAQQHSATESKILRKALDLILVREGIREYENTLDNLIGLFVGPSDVNHNDI